MDFFAWLDTLIGAGIQAIWSGLAVVFSHWWGWAAWAIAAVAVAFALRRALIPALADTYRPTIATTLSAVRSAGCNARQLFRRKGRS